MFTGKEEFKAEYMKSLVQTYLKSVEDCTKLEKFECLAGLIAEKTQYLRNETVDWQVSTGAKKVYYFSMEFLIGRLLENYLINYGIRDMVAQGLEELGENLEDLCQCEPDPGLGNGGLGRLAACFMDSMASLGIYGTGMGIRYRFGLFRQKIEDGYQVEEPDSWLENPYPWEDAKPEDSVVVHFGGYVDRQFNNGKLSFEHKGYTSVNAVPYDVPVVGYGGKTVNHLRLWRAVPLHDSVDMEAFNRGDYAQAMRERSAIEAISCILYPDDSNGAGRILRLKQEYFFVSAGMQAIVNRYTAVYGHNAWDEFPDRVAIHTNDTHPTLCLPEFLRILLDQENLEWDDAWRIATTSISFTNHTVLPEALEKWPIELFNSLMPRVYMIVEEIDRRWRERVSALGGNYDTLRSTAILWDGEVRMANMSVIGSASVNGVAALHSEILKTSVFADFYRLMPEKFNNKTNGVSHRRFLVQSNPGLVGLIDAAVGPGWVEDLPRISRLEEYRNDPAFLERFAAIKRDNKVRLAEYIRNTSGVVVDPDSVFDVQVKRIHAYKRQHLNALKILDLYNRIRENPDLPINNYTFIFSGKAAQGYALAKEMIKFINSLADLVNSDPVVSRKIKVVFIENFCVSNGQLIYPASDISEQISTAGKEASGTGCMKFMMNGAVTLGTLDGANVEIRQNVGDENIVIFGMTAEEAMNLQRSGGYNSTALSREDGRIGYLTSQLVDGTFRSRGCDFWGIYDALLRNNDEYFVLKDFRSYVEAWERMDALYSDRARWGSMSVMNTARSAFFSSDRTISEYADEIWHVKHN